MTTVLPAVVYGCGTLSLALVEEQWLTVFKIWGLRKIFGCNRKGIRGDWWKFILWSLRACTGQQTWVEWTHEGRSRQTYGTHEMQGSCDNKTWSKKNTLQTMVETGGQVLNSSRWRQWLSLVNTQRMFGFHQWRAISQLAEMLLSS
jgi:hypothetical protein